MSATIQGSSIYITRLSFNTLILLSLLRTSMYAFLTGLGDTVGVIIGGLMIILAFQYKGKYFYSEFHSTLHVAISSGIVTGSLWQVSVNFCIDQKLQFNETFWIVTSFSIVSYFTASILLRLLNQYLPDEYRLYIDKVNAVSIFNDFLFAITLGIADGFFVGTDIEDYPNDDWLIVFGIYPETSPFVGMCLSGASVLCGYLVAQSAQNLFLQNTWIDSDKKRDIIIRRASIIFGSQTDVPNSNSNSNETMRLVPHAEGNSNEPSDEIGLTLE